VGKVQRGMVGRRVPTQDGPLSKLVSQHTTPNRDRWQNNCKPYQLVKKVILSVDILTRIHLDGKLQLFWNQSANREASPLIFHKGGRGTISATHVLSLVLSRSSYDSIISERPGFCLMTGAINRYARNPSLFRSK
jgi:hypothetical protein